MKCKQVLAVILAFLLALSCSSNTFAHSGRTDGSGGHRDKQNKSGLGSYHYHCGGHSAHLHSNGVCPYKKYSTYSKKQTGTSNSNAYLWSEKALYKSETKKQDVLVETNEITELPIQNQSNIKQDNGVIGSVVETDIKAYINGTEIPAYNFNGNMIIIGSDLRFYGFNVVYNDYLRTSSVSLASDGGVWDPIITNDDSVNTGTEIMDVYETDIKVLINGSAVTGYNVEGKMAFCFSELASVGTYYYDNDSRTTNLWIR